MVERMTGLRVGALFVAVALSACGGGGGGSGTPVAPTTTSGLVPAAPTLGATLVADATTLRPLVVNGLWTYRGVETTTGAAGPTTVYTNAVSHQAGTGGAVSEVATNADNAGAGQQTVSYRAGEVHASSLLDLGNGQTQVVDQLELRSPVRVGDQYTILDTHQADGGIDLEGDGKNDAFDFAIYSRVIGQESVDLVSFPQATTVRVQTVILARFKLSSTGAYTDTVSGTLDNWYSPGVGTVKRNSDVPGSVVGSRVLTTETLVNWDGVNKGIGFLAPAPAVTTTGVRLQGFGGAVGFDTHALMMNMAGTFASQGVALSQVDARGAVTSTQSYAGINAARARLARVGDATRVVAMNDQGIQMYSYDAAGNSTAAGPVLLKAGRSAGTSSNEEFVVAGAGNSLWIAWTEPSTDPLSNECTLQVQPFDALGQPLTQPTALVTLPSAAYVGGLRGEGAPGRAVFVWEEVQPGGRAQRYALMEGAGAVTPTLHTLVPAGGASIGARAAPTPTGLALLWYGDFTGTGYSGLSGVTLGSAGEPLRSNALGVETEKLTLPWLTQTQGLQVAGGAKAFASLFDYAKLWQDDNLEQSLSTVTELTPGVGPLVTDNQAKLLARGVFPSGLAVVGLTGNVLVFADTGGGPTVTSVWRRP